MSTEYYALVGDAESVEEPHGLISVSRTNVRRFNWTSGEKGWVDDMSALKYVCGEEGYSSYANQVTKEDADKIEKYLLEKK